MQGNFEKNVQEKLDELTLTPGAPVWEKIALRIQPEKKRRRGLFWLAVLAALLIGGGWWLTQSNTGKMVPVAQTEQPATKFPLAERKQSPAPKKGSYTKLSQPAPKVSNRQRRFALADVVSVSPQHKMSLEKAAVGKKQILTNNHPSQASEEQIPISGKATPDNVNATTVEESSVSFPMQGVPNADSAVQHKKGEPQKEPALLAKDSAKKKIAAVQNGWSNKILFSAGWSSVVSPNPPAYGYSAPNNSTGGLGNGTVYRPSTPAKGASLSVGYAKEKNLTDRLAISVGLQYAFYSTKQIVGVFKSLDTAVTYRNSALDVSGYYTLNSSTSGNSSQTTYANRFHVVELPVGVQYQLLKGVPLQLTGGVSFGRLLHSNALTFDAASGVYYRNGQNNNRQSLNLFAGLQYSVMSKAGWKGIIGPVVQYNAARLQKVSSAGQHLLFAGIKTAVQF